MVDCRKTHKGLAIIGGWKQTRHGAFPTYVVFTDLCDQDGPEGKDSVIQPQERQSVAQLEKSNDLSTRQDGP